MESEKALDIRELLWSEYYIPDYQRNYAWEMKHVEQLIQDIIDYALENSDKPYYVGNIIVERNTINNVVKFETIDGQQRLTTLYIMLCALKNNGMLTDDQISFFNQKCLSFSYREDSENSLKYIYSSQENDSDNCEKHIVEIYNALSKKQLIESKCKARNLDIKDFIQYLLNNVKFLRIPLPEGIDKNHYFEVMNSRGVQLEQHEIIKSDLMSFLYDDENAQELFELVWSACSFMERYVQMNIPDTNLRSVIFGSSWDLSPYQKFMGDSPEVIFEKITFEYSKNKKKSQSAKSFSIIDFLKDFKEGKYSDYIEGNNDDDGSYVAEERFYSVIDFPNFLLHVLKLVYPSSRHYPKIVLDDKSLEKSFSSILEKMTKEDKKSFAKKFLITLLQCRFLFDKYSLRRDRAAKNTTLSKESPAELSREDDERKWCVKSLKQTPGDSTKIEYVSTFDAGKDADEILMLLCVFHVSLSSRTRKNWLQAILAYTYKNPNTSALEYRLFLKRLAATYMRDNYLTNHNVDLINLIYDEEGNLTCNPINDELIFDSTIDNGVGVERFILNYYEYLLWKENGMPLYEFSYRTTVEHFFPQNAKEKDLADIPHEQKDKFGNLCLLSSKINPKFSNEYPFSKINDYSSYFVMNFKLQRMRAITEKNSKKEDATISQKWWFTEDINREEEYARNLFNKWLIQDYELNIKK